MTGFSNSYRKFLYTDVYLFATAAIVTIAWAVKSPVFGFVTLVLLAGLTLVISDDILPLTAPIFYSLLMIYSSDLGDFIFMWPVFIPLAFAIAIFVIRNRSRVRIGKMFFPQLAVAAALLLGGAFVATGEEYLRALPSTLFLGVGVLAIYVLLYQFVRVDEKRDIALYFSRMMMYLGIAVTIELIIKIAASDVPFSEWGDIHRDVGWGNENNVATILSLTAPLCLYLSTRYRNGWVYTLIGIFEYLGIFLSFSRGGILFAAITGPVLLVYAVVKAVDRKRTGIVYAFIIAALGIFYAVLADPINQVVRSLLGQGVGVSGRDKLYAEAWELFTKYPIAGAGLGHTGPNYDINTMQFYWFHSTLFQVLANMGIIGFVAYAYYYIRRFSIACKRVRNPFNIFVLWAWIGFEGYSMIDTGTFVPFPTMTLVLTMALILEYTNKAAPFRGEADSYNRTLRRAGVSAEARRYDCGAGAYVRETACSHPTIV